MAKRGRSVAKRRKMRDRLRSNPLAREIIAQPFLSPEELARALNKLRSVKRIRAMKSLLSSKGIIVAKGTASQINPRTGEPVSPLNRARKDMLRNSQKPLEQVASDAGLELKEVYRERARMRNQGYSLEKPKIRQKGTLVQIVVENPGMTGKQLAEKFPKKTNERSWRQLRNYAKKEGLLPKTDLRRKNRT